MNFEFPESPLVVATVTQASDLSFFFTGGTTPAEILEFRLDSLHSDIHDAHVAVVDSSSPVMVTVRRAEEGGTVDLSDLKRVEIYEGFLKEASLADTELVSLKSPPFSKFVDTARQFDTTVIASHHDFKTFPGIGKIKDIASAAFDHGADVAKIAVFIEEMSDLLALADLVSEQRSQGRLISAMGMGPLGKLSRLVLARAGSCLNYGYLQTPNAPGQWSAKELVRLIKEISA